MASGRRSPHGSSPSISKAHHEPSWCALLIDVGPTSPRLLAISDLHLGHRENRAALDGIGDYPDDWLIVAGDIGERPEHLALALDALTPTVCARHLDTGQPRSLVPAGRRRPDARAGPVRRAGRAVPAVRRDRTRRSVRGMAWRAGHVHRADVPALRLQLQTRRRARGSRRRLGARNRRRLRRRADARPAPVAVADRVVPRAMRPDRSAPAGALCRFAHRARQSLAPAVRPRSAAARSAFLHLVRNGAHRELGSALSRPRRRLRPPAHADDDRATRRAVRRSLARISTRLARRTRTRVVPATRSCRPRATVTHASFPRAIHFSDNRTPNAARGVQYHSSRRCENCASSS